MEDLLPLVVRASQPQRPCRQGVRGTNTQCHSSPTHTSEDGGRAGGKSEDKNYLTFLSLIFLICERDNNNFYPSVRVSVSIREFTADKHFFFT